MPVDGCKGSTRDCRAQPRPNGLPRPATIRHPVVLFMLLLVASAVATAIHHLAFVWAASRRIHSHTFSLR